MHIGLIAVLLSFSAIAGENSPKSVCPNVSEDAKVLLGSVQTLQDELKKLPECQGLSEKVSTIAKVLNNSKWKEVKELLKTTSNTSLEGADVEELGGLANEAAYALADTIAQLSNGSNHCMPQKSKASFLGTLSGITREVSTVVGNVAGPYGQSVALVGNLLAASISGLDSLFKQNKVYDFKNPAEEMLFMNQFCAFTQAQQDISDYLELESKEESLRGLEQDYLTNSKIKDLVTNCPECAAFKIAWDTKEKTDRIVGRIMEDANIISVEFSNHERRSFNRCAEIHRAVFSENSDLNQFIKELETYENPMMSPSDRHTIRAVISGVKKLPSIYPQYDACIALSSPEILSISIKFNDFIRDDILALNESIFGQQMESFRKLANDRYRDPNGDYMSRSLDRVKWARKERLRVIKKVKEPNYAFGKQVVLEQRNELRERILEDLMPHYLKFRFKNNKKHIRAFMKDFTKFRNRELGYFARRLDKDIYSLAELTEALKANKELARYFVSSYDRVLSDSRILVLEVTNNKRYCDYLLFARGMVPDNRRICDERAEDIEEAMERYDFHADDIKVIADFDLWADKNLDIQSTYVKDYADHIKEWTDKGADRWIRINN